MKVLTTLAADLERDPKLYIDTIERQAIIQLIKASSEPVKGHDPNCACPVCAALGVDDGVKVEAESPWLAKAAGILRDHVFPPREDEAQRRPACGGFDAFASRYDGPAK